MTIEAQNWADRLTAAGNTIEERANTSASSIADSAAITVGNVDALGATVTQGANGLLNNITNKFSSQLSGLVGGLSSGSGKMPNELDQFASYSYIFTLGVLTPFEVNYPAATYRNREPIFTILRSGGGKTTSGRTVYDKEGKTEYFIEDIDIDTIITATDRTRLTNATALSFKVLEPYSMGNFLQALQVSALQAGYKNYLEAPFVLQVQFKGWDDHGRPINASRARRVYPIKLVNVTFNVTEEGSTYDVQAIPFNESAFTDQTQSSHTDIQISGATVSEMLQSGAASLTTVLNNRELQLVDAKQADTASQYTILFPTEIGSSGAGDFAPTTNNDGATDKSSQDSSSEGMRELSAEELQRLYTSVTGITNGKVPDTFEEQIQNVAGVVVSRSQLGEQIRDFSDDPVNLNKIGLAAIVKSNLDGGKMPMGIPKSAENDDRPGKIDRCKVQRSQDVRSMTFSSGIKIQDMIEQVVIASEYGRQIATTKADTNGMVPWFRISSQVYLVSGNEQVDRTGQSGRILVYRVTPYMVHRSVFQGPTEESPGTIQLKRQAVKEYNYIYTGLNKDIIDFDIKFNYAFFTGYHGDLGQLTSDSVQGGSQELGGGNTRSTPGTNTGNTEAVAEGLLKAIVPTANIVDGGGLVMHPESIVAMDFNEALVNSPADLLQVDLVIHGDPYFMADSGMGNYSSPSLAGALNLLSNGAMSYETGEVDIILNFRTPLDYGSNGYMDFPGFGSQPVANFSGLYKVIQVSNKFSNGEYTQELQLIRRRNQENTGDATSESTSAVALTDLAKQISATPEASK
jgi:hypothetical protein